MARMRRSSEQTLEYKIEQAEAKVAKTREAHEKAVDLTFITSEDAPEDEEK